MQCQKLKTYMETGRVVFLPARSIRPNPAQPRKVFRTEAMAELSESIRRHGVLQPLSVRRSGTVYELIAGERRLRAAQMAGLTEVPCIVMQMDDQESGMAAMIENLQRQDLDFIEEAMGISRLMESFEMSQEQVARMLGKSQSAIANKLRLLRHSEAVLNALRASGLTERHGRALLKLEREEEKIAVIDEILRQGMNVARTEKYIQELLENKAVGDICANFYDINGNPCKSTVYNKVIGIDLADLHDHKKVIAAGGGCMPRGYTACAHAGRRAPRRAAGRDFLRGRCGHYGARGLLPRNPPPAGG